MQLKGIVRVIFRVGWRRESQRHYLIKTLRELIMLLFSSVCCKTTQRTLNQVRPAALLIRSVEYSILYIATRTL